MSGLAKLAAKLEDSLSGYFRRRLNDNGFAREYTQETLLRFAKGGYDPDRKDARAILFGIARHILADHIKRLRHEQALGLSDCNVNDDILHSVASEQAEPDRILQGREELANVLAIIETMPKRPRQVLFLCRMHGMKHKQIAEQLGISKSMVEKHMMDATARLLRGLKKQPEVKRKNSDE